MRRIMSLRSRQELLSSVRERYSAAGRGEKSRVLDELIAATGYHRKYLVAQLGKRAGGQAVRENEVTIAAESTVTRSRQS